MFTNSFLTLKLPANVSICVFYQKTLRPKYYLPPLRYWQYI